MHIPPGNMGLSIKTQEKTLNFQELVGSEGRYLFFGKKILEHPNDHLEAFSASYHAYGVSTSTEVAFSNSLTTLLETDTLFLCPETTKTYLIC